MCSNPVYSSPNIKLLLRSVRIAWLVYGTTSKRVCHCPPRSVPIARLIFFSVRTWSTASNISSWISDFLHGS
ncbi:hypothetical protein IF1G_10847 [Cordyceps javanica]|uniref:Uncharacterized protein n=1 Tax=Cordyceps javanica TaxID=43265 RepID=A0A545UM44_9HYPO|nr:hypothetical protein IF1G_10847 [Cordyceps javanica]